MKKLIVLLAGLVSLNSYGFVHIFWDTSVDGVGRIHADQTSAEANDTAGRLPIGSIYHLIWSEDNVIDGVDAAGNPLGNDTILLTRTLNFAGRYNGEEPEFSDSLIGGYVFTRVFGTLGAIVPGTMYAEGPTWTNLGSSSPLVGPLVQVTGDPQTIARVDMTPGRNIWLNQTVVPEPSTLAFLGIGGLALALRRRFVA